MTERTLITKGGGKSAKGKCLIKHWREPCYTLCYAWPPAGCGHQYICFVLALEKDEVK